MWAVLMSHTACLFATSYFALHWQVTLIRLPRPLLLKFELLARTVMLRMKSWDVATFFEDDLAISAAHVDAYLSWSSCHHLPNHVTGWRYDAGDSDPAGGSGIDSGTPGTADASTSARAQPEAEAATHWQTDRANASAETSGSPPRHSVVFPWAAHRSCEARVPEDWIVGLIQYEHNPHGWFRPHDPYGGFNTSYTSPGSRTTSATASEDDPSPIDADERFLLSAGLKLNSAYMLYQHHGAPFLVTMVGDLLHCVL